MGQAIKELDEADRIGCKRPSQPGHKLSEGEQDKAQQDCQTAEDHHAGLSRKNEGIGQRGDEAELLEMVRHDRQRGELCGEGQQHELAQPGGESLNLGGRKMARRRISTRPP